MMLGALREASSNIPRILSSLSPWYLPMISGPLTCRKWALVSPATARANRVLPVPGGPYSSTPFGASTPTFSKSSGCRRGSSTISRIFLISVSSPPRSSYENPGETDMPGLPCTNLVRAVTTTGPAGRVDTTASATRVPSWVPAVSVSPTPNTRLRYAVPMNSCSPPISTSSPADTATSTAS